MPRLLLWLGACLIARLTVALIPDGYIMKVIPHCGTSIEDNPYITLITDLDARARAECGNGVFDFNNTDNVNFYLPVSFEGRNSSLCEFVKRAHSETYVVKVIASFGEPGQLLSQDDEETTVSCTFEPRKTQESGPQNVVDTLIAPSSIDHFGGNMSTNSTMTLQVTDVLGNDITGQDIDIGRYVQLKATSDGGSGELGIRPISCDAVGEITGKRYAIIRVGCGDGVIFNRTAGFTISNLVTTSPYFPVFHVADDVEFSFVCNFTLCTTDCNGSSCTNERLTRRSLKDANHVISPHITLATEPIHIQQPSWTVREKQ